MARVAFRSVDSSLLLALLVASVFGLGVPALVRRRADLGSWDRAGDATGRRRTLAPRPLVRRRPRGGSGGPLLAAVPRQRPSEDVVRLVDGGLPPRGAPQGRRIWQVRGLCAGVALLVAAGLVLAAAVVAGASGLVPALRAVPAWAVAVPWGLLGLALVLLRRAAVRRRARRRAGALQRARLLAAAAPSPAARVPAVAVAEPPAAARVEVEPVVIEAPEVVPGSVVLPADGQAGRRSA